MPKPKTEPSKPKNLNTSSFLNFMTIEEAAKKEQFPVEIIKKAIALKVINPEHGLVSQESVVALKLSLSEELAEREIKTLAKSMPHERSPSVRARLLKSKT